MENNLEIKDNDFLENDQEKDGAEKPDTKKAATKKKAVKKKAAYKRPSRAKSKTLVLSSAMGQSFRTVKVGEELKSNGIFPRAIVCETEKPGPCFIEIVRTDNGKPYRVGMTSHTVDKNFFKQKMLKPITSTKLITMELSKVTKTDCSKIHVMY